jgi:hypothetical protein
MTDDLLAQIERAGVLLQHDPALLSVTTLVAGAPVAGSWWAHPLAHQIYALLNELSEHPDLLVVKLVRGKATFVHRRLWPALLGVACAQAPWQLDKISELARELYAAVAHQGVLRAAGAVPKELERRLLVQSAQEHTERGHHELRLTHWPLWAEQAGCAPPAPDLLGRSQLEAAVQGIGCSLRMLPWSTPARTR